MTTPVAPAAATYAALQPLRDGRQVEIRALRPADRDGMLAMVARISDNAMYRRFFGAKRHFSEQETDYFVNVDFVTHVALVAVAGAGRGAIVAGGRYVVARPGSAELAFMVGDDHQGQGLGAALMRHLAAIARGAGLKEFVAEVLAENGPMLRVFERSGLPLTTRRDGTVIHVTLQL